MQHSGTPVHSGLLCRLFLPQQIFFRSYCRQSLCPSHCKSHMREAYHLRCVGETSYHDSPWPILQFLHNWKWQRGILKGLLSLKVLLGIVSLLGMVKVLIWRISLSKTRWLHLSVSSMFKVLGLVLMKIKLLVEVIALLILSVGWYVCACVCVARLSIREGELLLLHEFLYLILYYLPLSLVISFWSPTNLVSIVVFCF